MLQKHFQCLGSIKKRQGHVLKALITGGSYSVCGTKCIQSGKQAKCIRADVTFTLNSAIKTGFCY